METFDLIMTGIFWFLVVVFLLYMITHGIRCIKEKDTVIVERLGKYHKIMTPGPNFIIPFVDRTKFISVRYLVSENDRYTKLVVKSSDTISTQNAVMDFPRQQDLVDENSLQTCDHS